jgi:thiamine-monophosphate kinase
VLTVQGGQLVACVDQVVEGVHLESAWAGPADFGWKAVTTTLSDLAAMGATPHGVMLAVAGPAGADLSSVIVGAREAAQTYGAHLVGGDLSRGGELYVAATALGWVPAGQAVRRSSARPGDAIWVTGPLGAAAAGLAVLSVQPERARWSETERRLALAQLRPRPRISAGTLARRLGASAMIDISDGLSLDLDRLARASGVGFSLSEVPVADGADLSEALGGGEDYELCITISADIDLAGHLVEAGEPVPVRIGVCTDDPDQRDFKGVTLVPTGHDHFG